MDAKTLLAKIPKVDVLLSHTSVQALLEQYPRWMVLEAIRNVLNDKRAQLLNGEGDIKTATPQSIVAELKSRVEILATPSLRRVINATGVVLHTNLGRALLAPEALKQIEDVALNYSNLEYDLDKGERGLRYTHVLEILKKVTGAPAAMVVNNNASAVLLILASLASDREVVVSRGELIEIGGSFRIPEVMAFSGAVLREVGTTNKTHIKDYADAINERTALLMKVHPSNYRIVGFTREVELKELVALGKKHSLPVYKDLGSGSLIDLSPLGLPHEPTVQESIKAGVHLLSFSGDKLLGGPQAGIILGHEELVKKIRHHPLNRALRIGKLTLAGLEATLKLYMEPETLMSKLPTVELLSTPLHQLVQRARGIQERLIEVLPSSFSFNVEEDTAYVGGGALPLAEMPTAVVTILHQDLTPGRIEKLARNGRPAVIGRVKRATFLLDVRTVRDTDVDLLVSSLQESLA